MDITPYNIANPSRALHTALDKLLKTWREKNPRLLVTTRDKESLHLASHFITMRLLPFNDEQLHSFFKKWFKDDLTHADYIMKFLSNHERIKDVCRIPIVASIVASIHEHGLELPRSRTEVYDKYFDLMLDRWDRFKKVPGRNRISPSDKRMLLRRLAWELHRAHRRRFQLKDLARLWKIRLASRYPRLSAEDVLWELRVSNSVVFAVAADEFSLGHLSFQEFLAAEAAVFGGYSRSIVDSLYDPCREHVIVFYAGKAGDVEGFISKVQERHGITGTKSDLFREILSEARYTPSITTGIIEDILITERWTDHRQEVRSGATEENERDRPSKRKPSAGRIEVADDSEYLDDTEE
jgi:hypothetical protein